jgi:DNA-binding phage protein
MNLNRMIDQVAKEKGIGRETLVEALKQLWSPQQERNTAAGGA